MRQALKCRLYGNSRKETSEYRMNLMPFCISHISNYRKNGCCHTVIINTVHSKYEGNSGKSEQIGAVTGLQMIKYLETF
jgi:hypothetical protein